MKTPKKMNKSSFCGTAQAIVPCGPGECFAADGRCRREIVGLVNANRHTLNALLEDILKDCGPLTPVGVRAVATSRHGDVAGLLLECYSEIREKEGEQQNA